MPTMSDPHHLLPIHVTPHHTFFVSQALLCNYSAKLRRFIDQERRTTQIRQSGILITDFPGGPLGFEFVSRFCYNHGRIPITVSNVSLLHCCAVYLEMTEEVSRINLLQQTEVFLEGIFDWSWDDILACLKSCDTFFPCADSCGLIDKLICSLLAKIAQKSDSSLLSAASPSSSSSSPETGRSLSLSPPGVCQNASFKKAWFWWFQDLTILGPKTIQYFLKSLGAFDADNTNLVLTRFILHYLKTSLQSTFNRNVEYAILADTAVQGVVSIGKAAFSCRGLFWVLRITSGFGLSRERRAALERLIGEALDQATLDDLLISSRGGNGGGVYDVNLVIRLIRLFVHYNDKMSMQKVKKVGRLIDMYLREIGPDPNLKLSKFIGVAESLPDCARDSFDHVYRAIDIYLESHPTLSLEERSRLCRSLNYVKLSLEACKDLAKNPRIPPRIAVQALASQHSSIQTLESTNDVIYDNNDYQLVVYKGNDDDRSTVGLPEEMKLNLERMQWRVVELEKVCREMKGQMVRMVKLTPHQHGRPLPRLC